MKDENSSGKANLVQIIHDLKVSFRRTYGEKFSIDSRIENMINLAAPRVKKGECAEWEAGDVPLIQFSKRRRTPKPKRTLASDRVRPRTDDF